MRLVENTKISMKMEPGKTGGWTAVENAVNMANYAKCRFILAIHCDDAAVVGGAVTLKQGISAAACTTALAFSEYWKNEAMETTDALTKVTAATCAAGVRNKVALYIFEVRADMLDSDTLGSENQYVGLTMTDITTATEACSLTVECYEPRYARGAENMPSVF